MKVKTQQSSIVIMIDIQTKIQIGQRKVIAMCKEDVGYSMVCRKLWQRDHTIMEVPDTVMPLGSS